MAVVARIIGYSLLTSALGALIVCVFFSDLPGYGTLAFLLACVGAMVGVVAGAAGEIVTAQRRFADGKPQDRMSKMCELRDL